MNFKLLQTQAHKSLPAGLEWNNIPNFAIITGKNGTGKSHLLEVMKTINFWKEPLFSQRDIKYIPPNHNFIGNIISSSHVEQKKQLHTQALAVFKSIQNFTKNADVKNILKESGFDLLNMTNLDIQKFEQQYGNNNEIVSIIGNLQNNKSVFSAILEKTQHKKIEDLTEEEFAKHFPIDPYNDFTTALHLKQWFTLYIDDYDKKSGEANRSKDHKTQKKLEDEKPPWVFMNEILKNHGFKYQIVNFDPNITPLEIKFIDENTNITVQIESLSSGEQQIISLVAWAHHEIISENIKLLLLDEPDAHLHPNFCEIFIKIMNEYVVEKHKIKVIMTTHSPSTIAYANEENIFLMNMPEESNCTNRIIKQTKQEALRILSDGLMILSDNSIVAIGEIFNSTNQHILLCEGKTDKIHIEQCSLYDKELKNKLDKIVVISLGGADNFKALKPILLQMARNKNNTTILLDNDDKGNEIKKIAESNFNVIQLTSGNIEDFTKLKDTSNLFKEWIKKQHPRFQNDIEDTHAPKPDGTNQLQECAFSKYLKGENLKCKIPSSETKGEEANNVFKNLWCEYLKNNEDKAQEYYKDLVDFLASNIK